MKRRLVALALAIVFGGCFHAAIRRPALGAFDPGRREEVWSRALNMLQQRGWIIAVSDRAGGLLTTQQMTGYDGFTPYRQTLQLSLTSDGRLVVNLYREYWDPNFGWYQPLLQSTVDAIEAAEAGLRNDLLDDGLGEPVFQPKRID